MREIKRRSILAVIVSLMFTVGAQVRGAGPIHGAIAEAVQTQSDNRTLSFGEGRFFIDGKTPKGFAELEYLYLEGGSFRLGPDKKRMVADSPASLKGELQGKRGRTFKLKKAAMESDVLTFESQAIRGVSFQFRGTVFNGATEYDFVEIKGRLSKLVNGKKVAEAQVTFSYAEPTD
ncbi:MAG TPA: hypothetical protein VF791_09550 [Pyrinomonadaceae bacterium]